MIQDALDRKVLHVVSGLREADNGMAVAAQLLAADGRAGLAEARTLSRAQIAAVDEVWVHGMWSLDKWVACLKVKWAGARLVRMMHGGLSPVSLRWQGRWKKRLARPLERLLFALADHVVATGAWEVAWARSWGVRRPIETVDLKRCFPAAPRNGQRQDEQDRVAHVPLRVLYLGRRHLLKGVAYLERAVAALNEACGDGTPVVELRVESHATGAEKERAWAWCDVLCLPTLSENFGLVVAEALARGKPVITTDGAPAWRDEPRADGHGATRLVYLEGYCGGTEAQRVRLLQDAMAGFLPADSQTRRGA